MLRVLNGLRKLGAGLRPFSESVWPGVRNDLFVAHQSIYEFFGGFVRGRDVLDAGCGTGYGTARLVERGAATAVGVDLDRWNVRYARRHFEDDRVLFERADIEHLPFTPGSFDAVAASNSLEHLHHPEAFITSALALLRPAGTLMIAVPPIYTATDAATHGRIHYHRSNLTVREWHDLLTRAAVEIICYRHDATPGTAPDFASRSASKLSAADFRFEKTDLPGLCDRPSITAIFILQLP